MIPGLGTSLGEGEINSLQYSCLENPMDTGAWWATVHRVAKSQTWLKRLSTAQKFFYRKLLEDKADYVWICIRKNFPRVLKKNLVFQSSTKSLWAAKNYHPSTRRKTERYEYIIKLVCLLHTPLSTFRANNGRKVTESSQHSNKISIFYSAKYHSH